MKQDPEAMALGPGKVIYPHTGIALLEIAKVWAVLSLLIWGFYVAGANFMPPELMIWRNIGCFLMVCGGAFFAVHRLLHYTNTYVEIAKDALVYKKGWVPNTTDTIFWIHVKDVNSSASVTESLLGCGTVSIVVALRNVMQVVQIPYLPKHEEFAAYVREKIGAFAGNISQVTYT
jgi:membrane protein YdbS with pleckstrin-like domain